MQNEHPKPGRWLRDYVFWRDILSTLIGGLLVLITAFVWALFMGFIQSPGAWETIMLIIFGAVTPVLGLIGTMYAIIGAWKSTKNGKSGTDWFSAELEESFRTRRSSRNGTKDGEGSA